MNNLLKRILTVLGFLVLYRLGTYVSLPGVNTLVLSELAKNNASGMLGMLNMFSGGALGRLSIFSLNIMPYITASIAMQLFGVIFPELGNLRKEGESGRRKMTQYTKIAALVLAFCQGYGIAVGAQTFVIKAVPLVTEPGPEFVFMATITLVGGTAFVIWLTDQISLYGLGNGSSLIIFTGIVCGIAPALGSLLDMGKAGSVSTVIILIMIVAIAILLATIVFCERAQRRISVHYPRRQVGNKIYGGDATHLPLKLNTAGVMGPIFANALLLFPSTVLGFTAAAKDTGTWQYKLMLSLSHGQWLYTVLYIALIFFFSFFYTSIVFNPQETADNLRKAGAVIPGRRPGTQTSEYLEKILNRLTCIGGGYVALVCIVPELLVRHYSVPFYLGGTSILIVVNVIMDMFQQIQTYIMSQQYGNLVKNSMIFAKRAK